jgi:hypothetical protein
LAQSPIPNPQSPSAHHCFIFITDLNLKLIKLRIR